MDRLRLSLLGAAALACSGCAPPPEPSTFAVPAGTLAPVRMVPCPERVPAAATATHCPGEPR